jgi:hypothetical protein
MVPGRDGPSNAFPEIIPSVGPSLQNMYSHGQRIETDMLMKVSSDLHILVYAYDCSLLILALQIYACSSHLVSFLLCLLIGSYHTITLYCGQWLVIRFYLNLS